LEDRTGLLAAGSEPAADWEDLVAELDSWAGSGREVSLWWRDDDATEPAPALERLLSLADGLPLALGVIPALAERSLLRVCECAPSLFFLQHGWRHENRAGVGEKKSEFPRSRPPAVVSLEIENGRERLRALFGGRALAVFVPPWNRLDSAFLPLLRSCGVAALSRFGPRQGSSALVEQNVHLDLVAWGGERGFIGEKAALGRLVAHLEARRRGEVSGATGVLTHHRVSTPETEGFLERLFAVTRTHRAARWLAAPEVFAPATTARR
jgi:hypothetical protein